MIDTALSLTLRIAEVPLFDATYSAGRILMPGHAAVAVSVYDVVEAMFEVFRFRASCKLLGAREWATVVPTADAIAALPGGGIGHALAVGGYAHDWAFIASDGTLQARARELTGDVTYAEYVCITEAMQRAVSHACELMHTSVST